MANDVTNSNGRVTVEEIIHRDSVFRYQLLDRLRSDCEYYLNYGNRHPKSLWADVPNPEEDVSVSLCAKITHLILKKMCIETYQTTELRLQNNIFLINFARRKILNIKII